MTWASPTVMTSDSVKSMGIVPAAPMPFHSTSQNDVADTVYRPCLV